MSSAGAAVTGSSLVPSPLMTHSTPHHVLVLLPTPSAWPGSRPRCQVAILVLPVSWCCSCPVSHFPRATASRCCGCPMLPVPGCTLLPVPRARGAWSSRFSVPMIFWLPDAPGSLEPRLSGAAGFPVSRWSRFADAHGLPFPDAHGFPVPRCCDSRCSWFPGAHSFPSPRCPRFSRSLIASFSMFLALQLSSAHG